MGNIVAIVGRPNVGKSTFFNRLIETRQAITDNQSGVTRDRVYGQAEWTGKFFTVIDTGGYVVGSDDVFEGAIRDQVRIAIEESDVILFMVDCHTGLTPLDKDFANVIRQYNKPLYIIANKADEALHLQNIGEFYELGLPNEIYPVSAQNGSGTGDLLDKVVSHFEEEGVENPNEGIPKIAIIGRPNVGKSSFVNTLLGEERSIVTDIAGTTRDVINTHYKAFGENFILIDTAGVRKKRKVSENIEFYSVMRALKAIDEADVCILMIDSSRGFEAQDMNLISLAHRRGKGILIMVNKWDLIEKDSRTSQLFTKEIKEKIAPMIYIPIIFTSVINKQRIFQSIKKAIEVYHNRQKRISTSALNDKILPEIVRRPPPALKGKYIKIKYITQLHSKRISFAFFCNLPQYIKDPYKRFLENKMRENFDFEGVPIEIFFRKK